MESTLPPTAARVERVVWAYRGPRGRRWVYAAVWVQPASRVRVIVWTDRGRDRLQWFDTDHGPFRTGRLPRLLWPSRPAASHARPGYRPGPAISTLPAAWLAGAFHAGSVRRSAP